MCLQAHGASQDAMWNCKNMVPINTILGFVDLVISSLVIYLMKFISLVFGIGSSNSKDIINHCISDPNHDWDGGSCVENLW